MSGSSGEVAERGLFQQELERDGRLAALGLEVLRDAPPLLPKNGDTAQADRPSTLHWPVAADGTPLRKALSRTVSRHMAQVAEAAALELARGAAFTFVPVFLGTGALLYFFAAAEPAFPMLAGMAAAAGVAALTLRRWLLLHLLAAALFCVALGACLGKLETWWAGTQVIGGEITTRITGRVVTTDALANGRFRVTMDVLSTERPKLRYAPARVRISTRALPVGTKAGDVLTGPAKLIPPLGPVRPGSYDFSFHSYFNGIGASGYFLGTPSPATVQDEVGWSSRLLATVENARDALAERIRSRIPGAEGEIAAALIAGVEAGIPEDVNEDLRRTGLAHVLSISGLHMALVAATIIGTMRLGFALFPRFAARHPVRKYAAAAALVFLAVYLLISGSQVAAQRSFVMIAIMLAAVLFDRQALTMRNLALAAIVVLAMSPHEIVGPSFQMSFAATAALIGAYGGWTRRKQDASRHGEGAVMRLLRWSGRHVGGLVATSILAGTATTIFSIYHFQRVSPLTLFANLAAMPVVSIMVMPFAVLSVFLMPFGLDGPPLAVMGEGISIMNAIAAWFSERSPLDAIGLIPAQAVVLLSIALVLATVFSTWLRWIAVPFALAGLVLCFFPPQPLLFVAENARLIAIRTDADALALNRSRLSDFSLQSWKRAVPTDIVLKPRYLDDGDGTPWDAAMDSDDGRFHCSRVACAALDQRLLVVSTADKAVAQSLCDFADVIVLDDATAGNPCAGQNALLIGRRGLARGGSAMVFARGGNPPAAASSEALTAVYAASFPYRPWHRHRQFSREARGLAPWKPDPDRAKRSKSGRTDASRTNAPVKEPGD